MNTWVLPNCGWFGEHSGGGVTGNILALSTPEPRSLPPSCGSLFPASATPRPRFPKLTRRPTAARRCRLCPRALQPQPGTWGARLPQPRPGPALRLRPGCGGRCARGRRGLQRAPGSRPRLGWRAGSLADPGTRGGHGPRAHPVANGRSPRAATEGGLRGAAAPREACPQTAHLT